MAKTPSRPSSIISDSSGDITPRSGSGRWRNTNKESGIRYKICLSGKFDVGKTSIFLRLQGEPFSGTKPLCTTSTYEFEDKEDSSIEYSVWDTNGFEERNSLTLGDHYRNAHCVILVYDVTDFSSLDYLKYEVETIEKYQYAPHAKFILIQNKIDKKMSKFIPYEKQKDLVANSVLRNKVNLFWQTSAKTNDGIEMLFHTELQKLLCMPVPKEKTLTAFDRFIADSVDNIKKKKKKLRCSPM